MKADKPLLSQFLIRLAWLGLISSPATAFAQGGLTPPAPPAPMMLKFNQIEPRTPVDSVHTPGNGSTEFLISQPGSYYFTTNITGLANEHGIDIATNNVVLDLNGFSLTGPANALYGIEIYSGITNVIVRNGVISGWNPVYDDIISQGNNVIFENLSVSGAGDDIFCLGDGGIVRNCALNHAGQYGLEIDGPNYLVISNQFVENNTMNGVGAGIVIESANNCIDGNFVAGSGPAGYGIFVSFVAGVTNNILIRNSVSGNGANDFIVNTSQIVGPLITNGVSGIITNSNPWANFAF
jgi:hypothetical protein